MSIENAVVLSAANLQTIRVIVGAGQAVGFTVTAMHGRGDITVGKGYTFDKLDSDGDLNFTDDDGETGFISERNIGKFEISLHASEQDVERFHADALVVKKAKDAEQLAALRDKADVFLSNNDGFQVGQAIEWKEGMKHKKLPAYGEPVVVVEVLDQPIRFVGESGTQYFSDKNDIVVAQVHADGELLTFVMDSRRFKLFR